MKKSTHIKALVLALSGIELSSLPTTDALANPQDGQVTAGSATITQTTPNKVDITQTTDKAIIDWNGFSINANEHTQFHQPSAGSVTLNRVVGEDPSQILGRLTANGQVFLVNPNGIYFGKNAQIDVAGLVASTHNIRNEDFLAGRYNFNIPGKPGAAVINEGTINIADTGIAAFVAPSAANRGVIVAKLGRVVLAAANGFTLDFHGDKLLTFLVDDEVAKTAFDLEGKQLTSFVENAGRIEAQGGYVLLTAKAAENAIHSVINQSGAIEATTVGTHNGEIILNAGKGSLSVSGTLDASAPNGGDGGFIETSGGHVAIDPATRITTAAPFGTTGRWLIDPTDYTIAASGGDIIGSALAAYLSASNVEIQTLATGSSGNGDIFVNDSVTWNTLNKLTLTAHRNIYVNEAINGTGGGSVKLRADSLGTGVGTVAFSGNGHVTVNNGAAVGIYYNPVSYIDAATKSDISGNPYSNFVTLNSSNNSSGYLNTYMLVNNVNQLQAINTNLSGSYALGKDIDASATAGWNSGAGFSPIGSIFSGVIDGGFQVISNLFINRPATDNIGMFVTNSGWIKNLGLVNVNVTGHNGAGVLASSNTGNIFDSYTTGSVSGSWTVGGMVAGNSGIIARSYSATNVSALRDAGGLSGSNNGTIANSYATGNVTGTTGGYVALGALVGVIHGNSVIANSYATGRVSSPGGGLVAYACSGWDCTAYTGSISDSYWNIETVGQNNYLNVNFGTALSSAQMSQMTSFPGWDFANTWQITEGVSRPTLKASVDHPVTVLTPSGTPVQQHQTNGVNSSSSANSANSANSGAKSEQVRRNEDYLVRVVTMQKPYEMEIAGHNSRDDIGGVVYKNKTHKNHPGGNPKSTPNKPTMESGSVVIGDGFVENVKNNFSGAVADIEGKLNKAGVSAGLSQAGALTMASVIQLIDHDGLKRIFGEKFASSMRGGLTNFANAFAKKLVENKGSIRGGAMTFATNLALDVVATSLLGPSSADKTDEWEMEKEFFKDAVKAGLSAALDVKLTGGKTVNLAKARFIFTTSITIQMGTLSAQKSIEAFNTAKGYSVAQKTNLTKAAETLAQYTAVVQRANMQREVGDDAKSIDSQRIAANLFNSLSSNMGENFGLDNKAVNTLVAEAFIAKQNGDTNAAAQKMNQARRLANDKDGPLGRLKDSLPGKYSYSSYLKGLSQALNL